MQLHVHMNCSYNNNHNTDWNQDGEVLSKTELQAFLLPLELNSSLKEIVEISAGITVTIN